MRFSDRKPLKFLLALTGLLVLGTLLWIVVFPHGGAMPAGMKFVSGRDLYDAHCAVCHGPSGKGDGPGARVVRQPMRDFSNQAAMRAVNDRFLFEMIKKGGSQFGRSNAMPAWGMKLSDEEISAIVIYIRSLASRNQPGFPSKREEF